MYIAEHCQNAAQVSSIDNQEETFFLRQRAFGQVVRVSGRRPKLAVATESARQATCLRNNAGPPKAAARDKAGERIPGPPAPPTRQRETHRIPISPL